MEKETIQPEETPKQTKPTNQVRTLAHPLDTVSGATAEMFKARPSGTVSKGGQSSDAAAFKVIAIIAIVAIIAGIIATQFGLIQ